MIPETVYWGGSKRVALDGSARELHPSVARVWRVQLGTGSAPVKLPSALSLRQGGPHLLVVNGTGASLTVQNTGGSTVLTIPSGQAATISLADNSTANGVWVWQTSTWSTA